MYIATFPEDVMTWGATKVARLAHLRGFPESSEATTAVVRAVLRIAHPGLVKARIEGGARDAALAMTKSELEAIVISHPKLGSLKPLDWLCDSAIEACRFFPSVPELREIFTRYLPAASDSAGEAQDEG